MWVKERNKGKNKEKCVNRAIVPDRHPGITGPVIYSSTGTAYEGGSEGKTEMGGSPVVQGRKDRSLRTRRDMGETKREGPGKVSDTRESGTTRRSAT